MSGFLDVGGEHPVRKNQKLSVGFDLRNDVVAGKSLGILADRLPHMHKLALVTVRRRLETRARREIQVEYNIKSDRVRKDLRVWQSSNDDIKVTGYFRGIGLRNFGARDLRKSRRGVSYEIFRGKRDREQSAFFVGLFKGNRAGGNAHVAQRGFPKRKMEAGRYVGKMRDPLVTEYGPTVAQMLRKGRRPERLAEFARGVLRQEFTRQLNYYLGGRPLSSIPGASA